MLGELGHGVPALPKRLHRLEPDVAHYPVSLMAENFLQTLVNTCGNIIHALNII